MRHCKFISPYAFHIITMLRYSPPLAKKSVLIPVFVAGDSNGYYLLSPLSASYQVVWHNWLNGAANLIFQPILVVQTNSMKRMIRIGQKAALFLGILSVGGTAMAQLQLPDAGVNPKCKTGRKVGLTDIDITWGAPGVKGREGKIWGTPVAHYGFEVLGFGSNGRSPWRAGADENTTLHFSTPVTINGKALPAGKYGFHIALSPDSCTLIFSHNSAAWGSYFYNSVQDALRVTAYQQKNQPASKERLDFTFSNQTDRSVEVALEWERWRIPFKVEVNVMVTGLASIRNQLSSSLGFDPPSLEAGATWCLQNNVNYEEALDWINRATDPQLGGVKTFRALSTKAGLLGKLGKQADADNTMKLAMESGNANEIHGYGRQLLTEKRTKEALAVFEANHKKFNGAWPTNVGLMRGWSAMGDYKKALDFAQKALPQAPNAQSKAVVEQAIGTLKAGKPL
jgi:tetratricopeptide (TPR) repeat protein